MIKKVKPPNVISTYSGLLVGSAKSEGINPKLQKEMQKQIENIVKYQTMPSGVKYQKYTDVIQTLLQVRQNLKYQLLQLEKLLEERIQ